MNDDADNETLDEPGQDTQYMEPRAITQIVNLSPRLGG